MDKISVIIPATDNVSYITDCLSSIFKSTYRNLEIIIIDNGFRDEVFEASKKYQSDILSISSDRLSMPAAFNLGLSKATGRYVSFFNVQDINGKMRYELSMKRFQGTSKTGMVICATTFIDKHGAFMTGVSKFQEYTQDSFLGKMFELNHIKTISSTVMLSEVIKDVGGFDESLIYSYEYDLFLRIGSKSRTDDIDLPLIRNRITPEKIDTDWNDYRKFETMVI